jgi:hypothetical protein
MNYSERAVINTSLERGAPSVKANEPRQRFSDRIPKPLKRLSGSYFVFATPLKQGVNESGIMTQQRGG